MGSMVVIFSISAGEILSFPLNLRQADWKAGALLLALFVAHLFFPGREQRFWFAIAYFAFAGLIFTLAWRRLPSLLNENWGATGERCEDKQE